MKVLVVSTNTEDRPVAVLPYGACIAAESARRAGHAVRLLDLLFAPDPVAALTETLAHHRPDLVALSIRNIDNNDLLNPEEYFRALTPLMDRIRRDTDGPVVLGGAAAGVMPESLLRHTRADYAVLGDGEVVFPQLLRALENADSLTGIPGVAWREEDVVSQNAPPCHPLSSDFIDPGWERWVDLAAYRSRLASVPVQSRRGCPFPCVYCTYGVSEGKQHRLQRVETVAAAVGRIVSLGMRDVEFVDNVFNAPYTYALELCEALSRVDHGARLTSMELNPAFLDEPLLSAMVSAGFVGIGVTAESASAPVLRKLGKGFDETKLHRAAEAVRNQPLPCFWMFLLGGPGETRETVERTLGFAKWVVRPGDVAFFNLGIRIYPGTGLETIARSQGVLDVPGEEMLPPRFYFAPGLDRAWVERRVDEATAAHANILTGGSLSHPWLPAIHRFCRHLPLRRPLWRHTGLIRRTLAVLGNDIPQRKGVAHG